MKREGADIPEAIERVHGSSDILQTTARVGGVSDW